ncbi:MAG TPA: MFS transporter [Bacillota bacterium]|nr:MFS transporter [Bacillota bacterium]
MWKQKTAVFLSSQTLSLLGSSLVQYALIWYITLETKSGFMMTLYIVCGFLPTFLLSPFAGVWADRYDRKKLIMISDGLIAFVTLILAVVFMSGGKSLWLIMVAAALRAVGTAIQGPGIGAILPQFVPGEYLSKVNGISSSIQAAITLVSPIISGILITIWPMYIVFFIDVITAALAIAILLFFLQVPPHEKASQRQSTTYFTDMLQGFRYIKEHPYLISFFIFLGIRLFLVTPAAFLTPLQVARSFGSDVWRLTAIEVVFSGGMLLGGGVISIWGGFKNHMVTMIFSALIMGLCTIALGLSEIFWVYLIFTGIFGVAMPFFHTPAAVFIQEHVQENLLGRVFSINTMLFTSIMPLGMLIFGPVAEIARIEWILVITGLLMLVQVIAILRDKKLIRAGIIRAIGNSHFE